MEAIAFALIACIGWGTADFIGGLKSRSLPILNILAVSTLTGLLVLGPVVLARPFPHHPVVYWAVPAGVMGLIALYLLYRALSIGTMAILAPVSATGAVLPVIWGLVHGERLSGFETLGIAMALAGCAMAAMEKQRSKKKWTSGVGLAAGAALFIGLYFILMDRAAVHDPLWATAVMRLTTLFVLIPLLAVTRTPFFIQGRHLPPVVLMGVVDTLAAGCFALATATGMLSEVSVVSSLYPAVTALLSWTVIGERLQKIQLTGVMFALAGIMLISGA